MRKASDMNGDIHIVSTWLAENEMTLGLLNNDGIDYGKKRVSLKQRMLCAIYDQKYLESLLERMWRQSRTEPCCPSSIPHSSFLIQQLLLQPRHCAQDEKSFMSSPPH